MESFPFKFKGVHIRHFNEEDFTLSLLKVQVTALFMASVAAIYISFLKKSINFTKLKKKKEETQTPGKILGERTQRKNGVRLQ